MEANAILVAGAIQRKSGVNGIRTCGLTAEPRVRVVSAYQDGEIMTRIESVLEPQACISVG